jgi:hypothetical protein
MFVVQATLRRIFEVPASVEQLCEFFSDPRSFARHMPVIEQITPVAESDDVTRWRFCIRVPIVAPITWEFVMYRHVSAVTGEIAYSAAEDSPDFFKCDVQVRPNPNGATDADVRLQLRIWRPRARDIHPLAGIVGEHWISRVITDRMDKMATDFVTSGLREIQARTLTGGDSAGLDTMPLLENQPCWPGAVEPVIIPQPVTPNGHGHAYPANNQALTPQPQPMTPNTLETSAPVGESSEAHVVVAVDGLSSNRTESSLETPGSGMVTP